ncbi:MAG: hypothetical protein IKY94_05395 [Lachnospiraceae bacterium]|nr:hypothetical protein [Lachnospiraceae bacterium]
MNSLKRIFFIFITLLFLLSSPLYIFADNASGSGQGGGSSKASGGASETKSGYRMYVVDENGTLKSKVIDLVYKEPYYDMAKTNTRIGGGNITSESDIYIMDAGMPTPFIHRGTFIGNGLALKAWMRSDAENGKQHIMNLIATYLGEDVADLFQDTSKEHYCVLEPIAYHNIYTSNSSDGNSGVCFYGTFYNIIQFYAENGMPHGYYMNQVDNNILGRCMTVEFDQPNLNLSTPTSDGLLDINTVGNQGFGIQLYSNQDQKMQTTCDETKGNTPHPAPQESNGKVIIVKNYRTQISETEYKDDGCFTLNSVAQNIRVEDEKEYSVKEWRITDTVSTPSSITWESSIPGQMQDKGLSPTTVNLKNPSTTLYVLLEKTDIQEQEPIDADYKLGESQITRSVSLNKNDNGVSILDGYNFIWKYNSLNLCGGHTHHVGHSEECPETCSAEHTETTYCSFGLNNTDWTFKLKNENREAFPLNLAINEYWTDFNSTDSDNRDSLGAGSVESQHEHKVVLHRGSDSLSIAQFKNENAALDSLDNFNTVNKKSPTRKKADYTETVNFNFVNDSLDLTTTASGDEGCEPSDNASLENPLSRDVSILYKTYSGLKNGGKLNTDINTSEMLTIGSVGNKVVSGKMVKSGLDFSYHAYIKMRYDTLNTKDNEILVLSEYLRSMSLNDYAEIEWEKTGNENMELMSSQWSTHATAIQAVGKNSLLPGGSQMMLGIKDNNKQKVIARTYQCILEGDGRNQVEKTWKSVNGFTAETANKYHKSYVNSIITGLENLSVEQWQNKNFEADPFKGIKVYNEADISRLKNTVDGTASTESKYYFKNDRGTLDSGCLDVKEGNTNTVKYTFSSDTSGNILMNGQVILTKNQGVESLTGTALAINSRTLVVTKLVDSIERNKGNDPQASWSNGDGRWYNESFDGITVLVSTTVLETAYNSPRERVALLDPKLTVKSNGTSDLFSDYMVGQFKMKDYSAAYGMQNVLGQFKNNSVLMKDMDYLYYTKKFYVSNVTTQDLH